MYDVTGEVDPTSGAVEGTVEATLPVGPEVFEVHLRYFAGLPDFEAQAEVGPVAVDGGEAAATQRDSIITLPLPEAHEDVVELMNLGHWFPLGPRGQQPRPRRSRPRDTA